MKYVKYGLFLKIILLILLVKVEPVYSQNPVIEEIVEEQTNQTTEESEDFSNMVEDLELLLESPVNLNDANIENLERLHFLTELQIENLLNYVVSKGPMQSIFELQLIDGFDMETIKKMLPFVKVEEPSNTESLKIKAVIKSGNHKISAETKFVIQNSRGYLPSIPIDTLENTPSKYLGNKMKYVFRYRFNYKNRFFCGFTSKKDPGETIGFDRKKFGFDFNSFHLQANHIGKIKTLVIGDFQSNLGQGLVLWSGFGLGKSPDALNIRKKGQTLRYYSSTNESNFLRGIGTTIKAGKLEFTAFCSHKRLDASLINPDSANLSDEKIANFQNSGYHRTEAEIESRKNVKESILGLKTGINYDNLKLGINCIAYHYNISMIKSEKPYKNFEFTGNTNLNVSFDYSYFANKFNFFGETALSKNGAMAFLNGLVTKVCPQISFSILHRYYQKEYQAYYASSFGENSKIGNEQGLYYGMVLYPLRKIKISAYADAFQFSWLKYEVNAPSKGSEYFIQANYSLNKNISMYFRYRSKSKFTNLTGSNEIITPVTEENKQNFRYHISYQISPVIELRNRIEYVKFSKNGASESGFMSLQDINFTFRRLPLSIFIRYTLFDATYQTSIYAYENDLLYNFSIPAYSDKGNRFCFMVKYQIAGKLDLRLRYSQFQFSDKQSIGSGLDEIQGNTKSEIKLQLLLRL